MLQPRQVRHLLGILFINHVIASFWYLLGEDADCVRPSSPNRGDGHLKEPGGWLEIYEIPVTDWWRLASKLPDVWRCSGSKSAQHCMSVIEHGVGPVTSSMQQLCGAVTPNWQVLVW